MNDQERIEKLETALKECIHTFDYLVFHRTADMDKFLVNDLVPERGIKETGLQARRALLK
jgi:hypothetical protein